jgi:hypothetical protein
MARCSLELAEKRRYDFEKTHLHKSQIWPRNEVEKAIGKHYKKPDFF